MRIMPAAATAICFALPAFAQDRPNTILVMDGSGSMWGQIDGVAKITIAQDVVTGLLNDLPGEERLGLTVYGHRERGNCTDIETIVSPAEGTRDAIAQAVRGIKPLGKTPMTDAVIAAAEALRYTEDSATVILVSDGVETCNPDPCAAARLLEEAGIDFTAHVIGFDVGGDAEATAQMQCIADETGGMFIPASDAGELSAALTTVVEEPEPIMANVTFEAVLGDLGGPILQDPVLWTVGSENGDSLTDEQGNPVTAVLEESSYTVTAYRLVDELEVSADFAVSASDDMTVTVVFPEPELTASVSAPAEAPLGSTINVSWVGPNGEGDYISIAPVDPNAGSAWRTQVKTSGGETLQLLLPPREGAHTIAYFQGGTRKQIGETQIILTPVEISMTAPDSADIGTEIEIDWTGPDYKGDYIGVGLADADGIKTWEKYAYTAEGTPATIRLPSVPGDYHITYFIGQDRTPMAFIPIAVTEQLATLSAPAEAIAGTSISVDWTGPNLPNDYIGIGQVDATGASAWENYAYTKDGAPSDLRIPITPGDYMITYFIGQDRVALTTAPITVRAAEVSVAAPATAIAGATIRVDWTGPDNQNDYIGIGEVGASGASAWENYAYTKDAAPASLLVPPRPGAYEISYFAGQDRQKLSTVTIEITDVTATVTAPPTAVAGATITVDWTGPDYDNDYIGIGEVGASGASAWENYAYTKDGAPASVLVPPRPGSYEISYFAGQDREVLSTTSIEVTEVTATLTAPDTAVAGATIMVDWTGPSYDNDYVGIGLVGALGASAWENYFYTNDSDASAALLVPPVPGDYLITYFVGQDREALKARPITVTPIDNVQIIAADTAPAGSELVVAWDGPSYEGDYLGIGKVGALGGQQWEAYAYTKDANPAMMTLPEAPGDYLITYFTGQGRVAIKSRPLTIE